MKKLEQLAYRMDIAHVRLFTFVSRALNAAAQIVCAEPRRRARARSSTVPLGDSSHPSGDTHTKPPDCYAASPRKHCVLKRSAPAQAARGPTARAAQWASAVLALSSAAARKRRIASGPRKV